MCWIIKINNFMWLGKKGEIVIDKSIARRYNKKIDAQTSMDLYIKSCGRFDIFGLEIGIEKDK